MPEVRLIDANALIKDIAESIRLADEWEKESSEKKDKHGLKFAIDTRRSLMAMISRIKEAPTVEPEGRRGHWNFLPQKNGYLWKCSNCKGNFDKQFSYCPHCGARMDGGADNGKD